MSASHSSRGAGIEIPRFIRFLMRLHVRLDPCSRQIIFFPFIRHSDADAQKTAFPADHHKLCLPHFIALFVSSSTKRVTPLWAK